MMRWRNSCALGLVLALMSAGCGDTAATPGATTTQQGSSVVGAAGGRVALTEGAAAGAAVSIPAGALASSVTITVREGGAATELPSTMAAAGPVVVFGPEGQNFAVPVAVTVPATAGATALYTRPAAGGAWSVVEGATYDAATGTITGAVLHFSMFIALRPGAMVDGGTAPTCAAGTADCDANSANGCETNIATNPASCGACGVVCASGTACVAGACGGAVDAGPPLDVPLAVDSGLTCPSGYADCDANPANGCETNVTNNPASCGACGVLCPAGRSCVAGACSTGGVCAAGYADCNANPADGCEVNLNNNASHCGACGAACASGTACAAGVCSGAVDAGSGPTCPSGYADCDANAANGCETNLTNNPANCGACAIACSAGRACVAGACL